MVDRFLLATAIVTHSILAAMFVLTDGPAGNRVILEFSPTHGVHESDVPALIIWAVGVAAVVALWRRRKPES